MISSIFPIRKDVSGNRYKKRPQVSNKLQATSILWCVKSSKHDCRRKRQLSEKSTTYVVTIYGKIFQRCYCGNR